jgi:Secretion system C-terminal sorting domain
MKKTLLSIGLFCLSLASNAQCNAAATLNENFETFINGALPQNCWTGSTGNPKLTVATFSSNKSLQLYSFMTPTVAFYAVSPELTTIDGNSNLTFTSQYATGSAPGTMTIQVGTLLTATDYASFQLVATHVVAASTPNFSAVIPASSTHKFIALKVVADAQHVAALVDNVVYGPNLSIGESQLDLFKIYPNPSVNKTVTISYDNNISGNDKNSVEIYNLSGAKVFEAQMEENTKTLNLSELAAGVYILKLQSRDNATTKKLVLK